MSAWRIAAVGVLALSAVASGGTTAATAGGRGTDAVPGAHDCVPTRRTDRGKARVAWRELTNPFFALDHMTKDQALRLVDGRWHLLFSERTSDGGVGTGYATSDDLHEWTTSSLVLPESGSPDITRAADGTYVLTLQQRDPVDPEISRIHYRTADSPAGPWSAPVRLAPGLFDDERTIDAALAHTEHGLFLFFKRGLHTSNVQFDELAWSPSGSLDGPWEHLGEPDLPASENFQLLPIDGKWHLLATTIPVHQPTLFRLDGDPGDPERWLHWKKVRTLEVPSETWNSSERKGLPPGIGYERANSAYLCDARGLDGSWYLVYAGSTELTTHDGRGHAKVGIARSRDLKRWTAPGDR
jgi:hypothetical protein